jgi:excinuclease ABC subunit C
VQVFPLRGGKMIDRTASTSRTSRGRTSTTCSRRSASSTTGRAVDPAADRRPDGGRGLERARAVPLRAARLARRGAGARAGEKRRLAELAAQNARLALESRRSSRAEAAAAVEALEELREALNLESLPLRIECFDISNIQGQEIVGSMVVFQDGMPKKAHYRKFGVRGLDGQDDFAAMAEVVSRRFARLSSGTGREYDEGFAAAPNLVVIDGGKVSCRPRLPRCRPMSYRVSRVIALAKRIEDVFVPGRPDPILLDQRSAGLQLLQRVRDEAHRFALDFHRQRRSARARESLFDTLEGVGPVRRRALIQHFGSTESVLAASQEELEGVPGVPAKTARSIYAQLHKTGGARATAPRPAASRRSTASRCGRA